MLLLHVSDFHFGPKSRFANLAPAEFAKRFAADLKHQLGELKLSGGIDVVVATGDFAESGTRKEFELAVEFLRTMADELGLPPARFVLLPGNHDISWAACRSVENEQEELGLADDERDERIHKRKLEQYERMVADFYSPSVLSEIARKLHGGSWLYELADLGLSVAALNSCEKETHRDGERFGYLSTAQSQRVLEVWSEAPEGFRILALHHPPVSVIQANVDFWRKKVEGKGVTAEQVERFIADLNGIQGSEALKILAQQAGVHLVLHGHQHAGDTNHWSDGYCHVLSAGSLCLKNGELPQDQPLSCKVVELNAGVKKARVWSLSYAPLDKAKQRVERGIFRLDTAEPQPRELPIKAPKAKAARRDKPALDAGQIHFLEAYRKAFLADFDRWDLSASGVTTADHFRKAPAALDAMYLPLRLADGWNPRELEKGAILEAEDLLTRDRALLIRGQAGAGKTTWMRHTFRRLIRDERAFPLLLVLRDLALVWRPEVQGKDRSLVNYLENKIAQRLGGVLPAGQLRIQPILASKAGPRPILLVDGWDEIGPLGEEIRTKLRALMRLHPRLLVVVTSRPYDAGGRPSHGDGFDELDVQPLHDREVGQLSTLFFGHLHGADEARAVAEVKLFEKALERSQEARELGRTPLLLTMMLGIHSVEPLPDKRHRLYEACIRNLLSNLPERKAGEGAKVGAEQWCPDSDERLRVVARLAFELQRGGYQNSRRNAIVTKKGDLLELLPVTEEWQDNRERFLNWLVGTAGILTDRADGTLAFSHLSFQEYLAAYHLKATLAGEDKLVGLGQEAPWWETLVLWAALAGGENAERAETMIEVLLGAEEPRPRLLAGLMLADGLGTPDHFENWMVLLTRYIENGGWRDLDPVARAFAASRQASRRETLLHRLDELAVKAGWLYWEALAEFAEKLAPARQMARPGGLVANAIVTQLAGGEAPPALGAAAARCLTAAHSLWPLAPAEWALLQVWPGPRRILGARLEIVAAAGEDPMLAKGLLSASGTSRGESWGQRDLARDLTRNLARDLARNWTHNLTRDWVRYWARYLVRDLPSDWARYWVHDLERYWALDLARSWARDWACYWARHWARHWARSWARESGLPESAAMLDALGFELVAFGRAGARSVLAAAETIPDDPRWRLMQAACRLSLDPGSSAEPFEKALEAEGPRCGDPLWPALARHLARRALPGDRDLLEEAVRDPESRPEPLRSGLQFIARGDVIFNDGSVKTLEEICEGLDLDLPLLEDMPDEIDLGPDWDKELT